MVKETHKKLESLHNPLIKHLVKLKEKRAYREQQKRAVVFGNKSIKQIAIKHSPLRLFASNAHFFSYFPTCRECFLINDLLLKKVAGMSTFYEGIAEFALPEQSSLVHKNYLLACDQVMDPGNLGTLLRTALALGWEGIFLLPDCCDLYNDKTIKASKGASFLLPYQYGTHEELSVLCKTMAAPLLIADLAGEKLSDLPRFSKAVLVLSHEGQGVKEKIKTLGTKVTIPLSSDMESLNVSAAGAILMYAIRPQEIYNHG